MVKGIEERLEIARGLRQQGYNCAQCVTAAFEDIHRLPRQTALRLATGLGGGVGGTRQICGVVSAMALTDGMLTEGQPADKRNVYGRVSGLAGEFERQFGSCVCAELKKPGAAVSCSTLIENGIRLYHDFLAADE